MPLGERVRQLRQMHGFTQSQLGGSELSKSFISLLEKDRTRPSVETLRFIAQRLETSVDSLLGQEGHLPEAIANGLLTLSREAIRNREFATVTTVLGFAQFLAATYGLEEAVRESKLQAAQLALEQRQFADAWSVLEEVSKASELAKDIWRSGRALLLMGRVKLRARAIPEAVRLFEKALAVLRKARAGRDPARVEALIGLGTALMYLGKFPAAMRQYEQAARSEVVQRDPVLRGRALWGVGLIYRKMEKYELAGEYLLKAKDALESAEELADLMRVLQNLGQLLFHQGRAREALRYLHQALRVMDRLGKPADRASMLTEIAKIHLSLGSVDDAEHFGEEALEAGKMVGDPVEVAEAQVVLARVHNLKKDDATAIRCLKEAVGAFEAHGMRAKMADAARELGLLLRARGANAEAADYLAIAAAVQVEHASEPVLADL